MLLSMLKTASSALYNIPYCENNLFELKNYSDEIFSLDDTCDICIKICMVQIDAGDDFITQNRDKYSCIFLIIDL